MAISSAATAVFNSSPTEVGIHQRGSEWFSSNGGGVVEIHQQWQLIQQWRWRLIQQQRRWKFNSSGEKVSSDNDGSRSRRGLFTNGDLSSNSGARAEKRGLWLLFVTFTLRKQFKNVGIPLSVEGKRSVCMPLVTLPDLFGELQLIQDTLNRHKQ